MSASRLYAIAVLGALSAAATAMLLLPGLPAHGADDPPALVAQAAGSEVRKGAPAGKPVASPGAVTVNVFFLSESMPNNPDEMIEIRGQRYIYFNSPRLAAPARPLSEPKPRYPKGSFEQKDGAVILQLLISERGELEEAIVVCAAPPFEKSATDSVKGIRFRPAVGKDGPVKSYLLAEFGYGRGYPCSRVPD